jgi:phosphoribosylformylglycinamidine (FGAM) synthase-like enzyme
MSKCDSRQRHRETRNIFLEQLNMKASYTQRNFQPQSHEEKDTPIHGHLHDVYQHTLRNPDMTSKPWVKKEGYDYPAIGPGDDGIDIM